MTPLFGRRPRIEPLPSNLTDRELITRVRRAADQWELVEQLGDECYFSAPATRDQLAEVERRLAFPIPESLVTTSVELGHGGLVGGNVILLSPEDLESGRTDSSGAPRQYEAWPVAERVVIFGSDGADALYGVWRSSRSDWAPVIEIVLDDEPGLALVGDDIPRFLLGRMAELVLTFSGDGRDAGPTLDALGVPEALRKVGERCDAKAVMAWANPALPEPGSSPYTAGLSEAELDRMDVEFARRR